MYDLKLWNNVIKEFVEIDQETANSMGRLKNFPVYGIYNETIHVDTPNPDNVGIIVYATYVAWCHNFKNIVW